MGAFTGAKIVDDGLVFHYDMENVRKSWKGRPATNIVTYTNLDNGWSKGYNTSIQWNDYPPPLGVKSQVVSFIDADGNGSGYWYSYGNYAPQGDGVTYYVSVWARTVGADWTIQPYTADNSETGRIWLNTMTVPGDGKWYRLEFNAITTTNPNDSDSLSFQFNSIPANQRCWLCAPQMTTDGHSPFVNGTRSSTQALIDLTDNYTLTINNLVYNSDGTFSFGGSHNIDLNSQNIISGTNPFTIESWTNLTSGNYGAIFGNYGTGYSTGLWWATAGLYISGAVYHSNYATTMAGKHHSAVTRDSSGNVRLYRDGVLVSTGTLTASVPSNVNFRIGTDTGGTSEAMNGDIYSVKVYNRVLSSTEINRNFEATRGRYGL